MDAPSRYPSNSALQLKVTLLGVKPPIWRRILVPASIALPGLHRVFQVVMGWEDSHLHAFEIKKKRYVMAGVDEWDDSPYELSEDGVKIAKLVEVGDTFVYLYDFGDDWRHLVVVEAISSAGRALVHASCLGGERACPPEDVGGTPGYYYFLQAISDPSHEEHEDYLEWAEDGFDPEAFNLADLNARLQRLR